MKKKRKKNKGFRLKHRETFAENDREESYRFHVDEREADAKQSRESSLAIARVFIIESLSVRRGRAIKLDRGRNRSRRSGRSRRRRRRRRVSRFAAGLNRTWDTGYDFHVRIVVHDFLGGLPTAVARKTVAAFTESVHKVLLLNLYYHETRESFPIRVTPERARAAHSRWRHAVAPDYDTAK